MLKLLTNSNSGSTAVSSNTWNDNTPETYCVGKEASCYKWNGSIAVNGCCNWETNKNCIGNREYCNENTAFTLWNLEKTSA